MGEEDLHIDFPLTDLFLLGILMFLIGLINNFETSKDSNLFLFTGKLMKVKGMYILKIYAFSVDLDLLPLL